MLMNSQGNPSPLPVYFSPMLFGACEAVAINRSAVHPRDLEIMRFFALLVRHALPSDERKSRAAFFVPYVATQ